MLTSVLWIYIFFVSWILVSVLQDPDPPNDPYIQVRVMKDYGEVTFSNGSVNLREGLSLWLLRDEAHTLMMEGVLECV
jgi:hypothetical protein